MAVAAPIKMMCKVTLLFLFGFLGLRVLSMVIVLACWALAASRVGKGFNNGDLCPDKRLFSRQNLGPTRCMFLS